MAILNTDGTQYAFSKIKNELNQLKSDLDGKVKYTDSLSYEELMASNIDLTNKVASANSVKTISDNFNNQIVDINGLPYYNYNSLGTTTDNEAFFKAWCNKVFTDHKDKLNKPIIAKASPNTVGVVFGYMYTDGPSPTYAGFIYFSFEGTIYNFGYSNSNWFWKAI